jgi:uncharacterized membrane protein
MSSIRSVVVVIALPALVSLVASIGSACGGPDCTDVPKFADVKAFSKSCVECHSSELEGADRKSAPTGIDFDTYEGAKKNPEKSAEEIEEGEMPPSNAETQISDDEKAQAIKWLQCGTPE